MIVTLVLRRIWCSYTQYLLVKENTAYQYWEILWGLALKRLKKWCRFSANHTTHAWVISIWLSLDRHLIALPRSSSWQLLLSLMNQHPSTNQQLRVFIHLRSLSILLDSDVQHVARWSYICSSKEFLNTHPPSESGTVFLEIWLTSFGAAWENIICWKLYSGEKVQNCRMASSITRPTVTVLSVSSNNQGQVHFSQFYRLEFQVFPKNISDKETGQASHWSSILKKWRQP